MRVLPALECREVLLCERDEEAWLLPLFLVLANADEAPRIREKARKPDRRSLMLYKWPVQGKVAVEIGSSQSEVERIPIFPAE